MGLSSFQGIEIIIIVKWQLTREASNGKTGARVGNIQRYQEAGFRGKFLPSPRFLRITTSNPLEDWNQSPYKYRQFVRSPTALA